jgi:hypothetical protein
MGKRITQLTLRNFHLDRQFDRKLLDLCLKISPGTDEVIRACENELQGLLDTEPPAEDDLAELEKLSPTDVRYWMKRVLEAKIECAELFSVLAALDVKMSLLAMNLDASYRGWLQKIGVDSSDPFRTCPPAARRPRTPHLRLVKR